jgi:uncharacterized protein YchJ
MNESDKKDYVRARSLIVEESGSWYYIDETEQLNGPFDSKEKAEDELAIYVNWLNQEDMLQ